MSYWVDDAFLGILLRSTVAGLVGGTLFHIVRWLIKRPDDQPGPTFQLHQAQASFIYLSLETPSGKGWAKTGIEALDKLVALQIQPPMPVPLERKDIGNLRRKILNNVEKTGFVKSSVVYIAGQDREATQRVIRRLMPTAAIKLV